MAAANNRGSEGREAVGVIGGSGLYEMEGLEDVASVRVETPFGSPSDELITGSLEGVPMVFLPRHGRGHRIPPSFLNARANIYAMKKLGVSRIVSVSAVGSMREEIRPGDIVVVDQFFDRTHGRPGSFFGEGLVVHVLFADPVCPVLSSCLFKAGSDAGVKMHEGGTYLVIQGPQFSTRAESKVYRQWGVDVIGMTNLPEARLAREAEICYATLALATDYDCWHETEEDVSVGAVLAVLQRNVSTAQRILRAAVGRLPEKRDCLCARALEHAIITDPRQIPAAVKRDLHLLIGKYVPAEGETEKAEFAPKDEREKAKRQRRAKQD
jgi:5'-methylthioadenosine phosphorylase